MPRLILLGDGVIHLRMIQCGGASATDDQESSRKADDPKRHTQILSAICGARRHDLILRHGQCGGLGALYQLGRSSGRIPCRSSFSLTWRA